MIKNTSPALAGVRLRRQDGSFAWMAKVAGRYNEMQMKLEEAEERHLVGAKRV